MLIHPGAGALWKRWPAARFAEVAARLRAEGREVALIAGPADDEAVRGVLERITLPVLRDLPPRILGAVLAHGSLYLGNDSGVSHLAAASGTRTVALFGPTDPVMWAPLGNVGVIRRCACIARVQGDVRVCGDPECMSRISVEEVTEGLHREYGDLGYGGCG
jgi:ADP-heptose:LPS heptosyltransferase